MYFPSTSVIIATNNRAGLLPDAVHSILDQTWQDFEVILVDDCSTDTTPQTIRELCGTDPRIRSLRTQCNSGPGVARNLGIAHAKGEFIAILDDDDVAVPERLELQTKMLRRHREIDVAFSPVLWVDEEKRPIGIFPGLASKSAFPEDPHDVFRLLYLESNKIPNTTLCFRKTLFTEGTEINGKCLRFRYPVDPRVGEDWYLVMQMSAAGVRMLSTESTLVFQQRGSTHVNLMKRAEYAYESQRRVLRMIRSWLAEQGICVFDGLHRLAFSNQLTREARGWGGRIGVGLCLKALLASPSNPEAYKALAHFTESAFSRLTASIH